MTNKFWPLLSIEDQSSDVPDIMVTTDSSLDTKNGVESVWKDRKHVSHHEDSKQEVGHAKLKRELASVNVVSQQTDKYNLQLRFLPHYRDTIAKVVDEPIFKLWDEQNVDKYGFMPLSDLLLPDDDKKCAKALEPLEAYSRVNSTQQFNFMVSQVQVALQLNPDRWDYHLRSYWDS